MNKFTALGANEITKNITFLRRDASEVLSALSSGMQK